MSERDVSRRRDVVLGKYAKLHHRIICWRWPAKARLKRNDVHNILGKPLRTKKSRFSNESVDFWSDNGLQLTFTESNEELAEIGLYPSLPDVEFNGIKLFGEPGVQVIDALRNLDDAPLEKVGIMIFCKLGLSVTGLLGDDAAQKCASVFARGRWDV